MDVIPRKSQMLPEQSITSSFEESIGGSSLSMILIAITFWIELSVSLRLFKERILVARQRYHEFVEKGISMDRRMDLNGGGLIRSMGGWAAVK